RTLRISVALTEQNCPSQTFDLVARSRNLPVLRQHGSENTRHATKPIHTARLEGALPAPGGNRSTWVRICCAVSGSWIAAITRTGPPHRSHTKMSISTTRFRSSDHE